MYDSAYTGLCIGSEQDSHDCGGLDDRFFVADILRSFALRCCLMLVPVQLWSSTFYAAEYYSIFVLHFALAFHHNCIPMLLPAQDPEKKSAPRCHWRVFYPEQLMASAGSAITDVIVITKGAVRMRFPPAGAGHGPVKPHTVVASVGECTYGAASCSTPAAVHLRSGLTDPV